MSIIALFENRPFLLFQLFHPGFGRLRVRICRRWCVKSRQLSRERTKPLCNLHCSSAIVASSLSRNNGSGEAEAGVQKFTHAGFSYLDPLESFFGPTRTTSAASFHMMEQSSALVASSSPLADAAIVAFINNRSWWTSQVVLTVIRPKDSKLDPH